MAVPTLSTIQNGDSDDASIIHANFQAILTQLTAGLDASNMADAAAILHSMLDLSGLGIQNLVVNGNMEAWGAGASTYPSGWSASGTPAACIRDTAATGHGSYCVKITTDAATEGITITVSGLKASTTYRISCRAKATSGDTAQLVTTGGSTNISETTTSTSWTALTGTAVTDGSGTSVVIKLLGAANGDIVWFDSVVMTEGATKLGYLDPPHTGRIVYVNADSDAVDVTDACAVCADTSSGSVVIGGFASGKAGQRIVVYKKSSSNNLTIEHNESSGTQKVYSHDTNDITLTATFGGVGLFFDGSYWYEIEV